MEEKLKIDKIPNPVDFLFHTPLYKTFNILPPRPNVFDDLKYFKGTEDCFCTGCGKHAPFKGDTPNRPPLASAVESPRTSISQCRNSLPETGPFCVPMRCTREPSHVYYFIFYVDTKYYSPPDKEEPPKGYNTITKIGQYPSYSDINSESIAKYRKVLDKVLYSELSKAIGLASHDIGVGSFVYLRRIFESLIEDAHQVNINKDDWDEAQYVKAKMQMNVKIELLKDSLPEFLVDQSKIYSILSKGIHELTEDECLTHFEVVKTGIELILDEKIEKAEKEAKIKKAKKALQHVHESVK